MFTKKTILLIVFIGSLFNFNANSQNKFKDQVEATIDLNSIKDDKVSVTITPPKFKTEEVLYHLPKIVPGTYTEDNYGKYIDNLKAYTNKGEAVSVSKIDDNTWQISNAKKVIKITYNVNDTFDTEIGDGFGKTDIFSPAGSNIEEGKNIMLNTHCFIGYFSGISDEIDYKVTITHPASLWGATSMTDIDSSDASDVFTTSRYAELVENPIMYSKPDYTSFTINGMDILIAVYSPNGIHTAESLTPEMKKMMSAQKNFLGTFNTTKKYSVLIYLSDVEKSNDAKGFGALEHPTATTVVMPEAMPLEELSEQLKDVVSHEFFHIVTPLTIHSKEIQFFDYTTPKMSEHLWMYEGVTEYFANLFQINQGLISEEEFYERMSGKIANANELNDTMSFTKMSENVLNQPYKDQYLNVYEKGALIGMCLDIIIREKSNGERGILDLMQKLSNEYGANKPFNDNELFDKITAFTFPEVGTFLTTYVAGETPIPYETFFAKVGVTKINVKVPGNVFIKDKTPYITVNPETKTISIVPNIELNDFFNELGLKGGDAILAINDINYNLENIYDMLTLSESWKNDELITVKIKRDGKEQIVKGKTKLTFEDKEGYEASDKSKTKLKEAWLKG
ncbi:M61 family metallopeptidase [Flavobacterium luteum]|uniref:Peptidase M61 n=1 Tax=Flavobacterium luteum TaxID=2026654 RepID=A0A7J5AG71_9FLAO|nr:peptidase M61 [Flavobacterium luteum]KAB1156535.1 peptidase M61 [Flavobacterium luteum]